MIKNRLISTSTILGVSLLGIVSTNQYAQATNLVVPACTRTTTVNGTGTLSVNIYTDSDSVCSPPATWTPQLFAWEGRAGAGRAGLSLADDYTFAIGDNGAQLNTNGSQPTSIRRPWTVPDNGAPLNWVVDYNAATKIATFNITGQSVNYTSTTDLGVTTPFNGFSVATKVLGPDGKIVSGTNAQLVVDRVVAGAEFVPIGLLNPLPATLNADNDNSTLTPYLNEILLATVDGRAITRVEGRLSLIWPGSNNPYLTAARGRVGFTFKAFDPPVAAAATVPEPSSILGLGSIAALAFGASLKRKLAKK